MTLKQTESLLKMLRNNHVSHFKTLEIEVRIGPPLSTSALSIVTPPEEITPKAAASVPQTAAAAPPVKMEIPHHINEVAQLLKLSDEDLVEKLFPDPSNPAEAE